MSEFMQNAFGKVSGFWTRTNVSQRVFIAGLALAVIGAFFTMILLLNRPEYRVLYSRLYPEDANRIVETLKGAKVNYKLGEGGTTILVPEDQVYELRLKVAGEGSLVGDGVGFEIFDEIKVGQTEFVQKINYQRALQGELSRTIAEFPQVEKARVHLVIPQRSLFIEEQHDPSASVVLKLADGEKMEKNEVQAVVNLVAMAVEGLDRNAITVADSRGKILFSPKDDASLEGLTTTQLEYKLTMQQNVERRIEQMLYPVIGPGRVIAKVNADVDFSQRTIHKKFYDPESAVVRSEQRSEETTQGRSNLESGIPEDNFRGEGPTNGLSTQDSTRETRTTNFEINEEEQNIVAAPGELQRMTVAVIVDGTYQLDENTGEYTFVPRSEEELARIRQLVENAVGFDSARGDTVDVQTISFGGPELADEPSLVDILLDYALRLGKPFLNALLIFLFLVLVVRPVIMALIRPRVEGEMVEGLEGLPDGSERLALLEGEEDEYEALDAMKKIEDIKAHALQMSEQNMEQAVNILKSWMKQEAPIGRAA